MNIPCMVVIKPQRVTIVGSMNLGPTYWYDHGQHINRKNWTIDTHFEQKIGRELSDNVGSVESGCVWCPRFFTDITYT